jgi:beta-phosphoglucomutase
MINTIIFDAEGVVVDSEPIWDKEQRIFLKRRGCTYERKRIKHLITGKSLYESTFIINQVYKLNGDPYKMAVERKLLISQLLETEVNFISGFQDFFSQVFQHIRFALLHL